MFIISTIKNKQLKENIVTKKINEFVTKIINYINSIDFGTPVTANASNTNSAPNATAQTSSAVQPSNVVNLPSQNIANSSNAGTQTTSANEQPKDETPQS